jgi:hypothetical protein
MHSLSRFLAAHLLAAVNASALFAAQPAGVTVTGDWGIQVVLRDRTPPLEARLKVPPPAPVVVNAERHDSLPRFNPNAGGWVKGAQLRGVQAQETTTPFLLEPGSLVVRTGPEPTAERLRAGEDYGLDGNWGTFGRTERSRIAEGQPVFASYRYTPLRLDAVVLTAAGRIELRPGTPKAAAPSLPPLGQGERLLGSIWLPGRVEQLAPKHLFPVLEAAYPEPAKPSPTPAERFIPKALAKLQAGHPLRILAWGDSVTDGSYLPRPDQERWQEQLVARLRARFPQARLELVSEAWGGRNTTSYLAEPPGSPHNYHPDARGMAIFADAVMELFP